MHVIIWITIVIFPMSNKTAFSSGLISVINSGAFEPKEKKPAVEAAKYTIALIQTPILITF